MRFLGRLLITMVGIWLAATLVTGISVSGFGTVLLAALILGLVNALVRPIFIVLTLPITVVTLGLFLLVINAIMLALVALLLPGMAVGGFWAAFLGAIIISVFGWIANWFVGNRAVECA